MHWIRVKSVLSFGFGDIFSRGTNWLMLFIMPMFLEGELFGKASLLLITIQLISSILVFGLNKSLLRYFASEENKEVFNFTVFAFWLFLNIPIYGIFSFIFFWNGSNQILGIELHPSVFLVFLYVLFYNSFRQLILSYLVVSSKSFFYGINQLLFGSLRLGVVIWLIYYYRTIESLLIALGLVSLFFFIIELNLLKKNCVISLSKNKIKLIATLGFPLVFNVIAGNILSYIDRFFIEFHYGYTEVGIYTFAYTLASGIAFLFGPLVVIFEPLIYNNNRQAFTEQLFLVFSCSGVILLSIISLLVLFFFPSIISWFFAPSYMEAIKILPIVLLSTILNIFYLEGNFRLTLVEKTKWLPIFTLAAGFINIVLNYFLIPMYGMIGAAIATLISYSFQGFIIIYFSKFNNVKGGLMLFFLSRHFWLIVSLTLGAFSYQIFYAALGLITIYEILVLYKNKSVLKQLLIN